MILIITISFSLLLSFRKKVMDDWYKKLNGVVKRKPDQNCLHQQALNYPGFDNSSINYNNGINKPSRWDCTSQATHISKLMIIIRYVTILIFYLTTVKINYAFNSGLT